MGVRGSLGGAGVSARPSLAIHSIVPGGAKLVSKAGLDGWKDKDDDDDM